jgi:anaerobic magnesium-protoporphyrin IX monomethyl ester cyclase
MKILFLDIYKKSIARISKDTAGGYGTENNLGDGLIGKTITYAIKNSIFWPNLAFIQLLQEFKIRNYDARYMKHVGTKPNVTGYDIIFVCNSIVCFETEILAIKNILKTNKIPIFLCGTFAEFVQEKIPDDVNVLSGNYEFLFQKLEDNNMELTDIYKQKFLKISNGNSDKLSLINWGSSEFSNNKNLLLGKKKNYFPFIISRGCPYSCREYCTYPTTQGLKVNRESESATLKKLKTISKKFNSSHIVFRDPVFSINIQKTKALLKEIGDASLNIDFSAELHLNNIDDEFIELCKYANLTGLKFGIESALEEVRNSVNRFSVNNDQQKIVVDKLKKNHIKTVGMFILAQPTDNIQTCQKTIEYATTLNIDLAQFSIFTPYPGTPYYNKIRSKVYNINYENFNQYQLVYEHDTISPKQARELLEKAYKTFINSKIKKFFFNKA